MAASTMEQWQPPQLTRPNFKSSKEASCLAAEVVKELKRDARTRTRGEAMERRAGE